MIKKKTNGKDPAVLFYTQDFIVGTLTMTHEERGKYILLLCMQHQKEGKLTLKDLKSVLSEEDVDVASKFPLHDDGYYYNDRMKMHIENRKIKTDSSRKNGALGGRPKTTILPNDKPKENPQVINRLTQIEPINNPTGTGTGNETGIDNQDVNATPVYTRNMLERIIDKFISVDSRFKLNAVMVEINEDYGGFENLLEMYLGNDTSAKQNYINQLNQYNNGIFK